MSEKPTYAESLQRVKELEQEAAERKRTEEALHETEQWLPTTLRSISDGVIATDAKGLVTLVNPVAENLTGWSEAEAVDKPLEEVFNIINKQTGERAENPVYRVLREGAVVGLANDTELIARDGTKRPIADSGAPIRDEEGDIIGTIMVFRDITERKRAEKALQESEEKLSAFMESATDGFMLYDSKLNVLEANGAAAKILNLNREDLIGKHIIEIAPNVKKEGRYDKYMEVLKTGEPFFVGDLVPHRKFGDIHLAVKAFKVSDGLGIIFTDITEYKQAEEALQKAHDELELRMAKRTVELKNAVKGLAQEINERKRTEKKQAWLQQRLEALWKISKMVDANEQDLHDEILTQIKDLTQSSYAFLGFLNEDESDMALYSWSKEAMEECQIAVRPINFPIADAGIWGDVVRKRNPLIINNYQKDHPSKKGIPDGHVPLTRILVVPIFSHNRIVTIAGLANKASEYTQEDVDQIRAFVTSAQVILERRQAEEAVVESELWMRSIFSSLEEAVLVVTPDRFLLNVNEAAQNVFGYSKDELVGLSTEVLHVDSEHYREFGSRIKEAFDRGAAAKFEFEGKRKNGDVFPTEHTVCLLKNDLGESMGIVSVVRDITERKRAENELRKALSEIEQLKEQLQADYTYLQEEIKLEHNFDEIIGKSDALKYVLFKIEQVASADTTVLILGETGTGKELVARAIHSSSPRKDRPLVKVNCATLPSNLIESELFGYEKGAFTGAQTRRVGRFELAHGATIFLDEICELPMELQSKLLRVLQEGEFERLGSSRAIKVDVRIIAATNRNLKEEVRNGRFREDLYYRLNVFPITIPPLRQRKEDIPLLVNSFVNKFGKEIGKQIKAIPPDAMNALQKYYWRGNIRELENVIEQAVIISQGSTLHVEVPKTPDSVINVSRTLEAIERDYIVQVLEETHWKISGKNSAAATLGLNPSTLRSRMKRLGIQKPGSRN